MNPFQSNRSPCVSLARADADLGPEPVTEPVREPRARVDKDSRAVDAPAERLGVRVTLRDDTVGVVGGVVVDVGDCGGEGGDDLDGERELEELGLEVS